MNLQYFKLNLTYFKLNLTYFKLNLTYFKLKLTNFNLCLTYFILNLKRCSVFMTGLKTFILLDCSCTVSADAVWHKDYTMKCKLLIGGIHFMHIFVVDCTAPQIGLYSRSVPIYDNDHFHFLETFYKCFPKMDRYFSKMASVPD